MAGSYNHCVSKVDGKLLVPEELCGMLECRSGDVYEAVEEMYGMIWWLASQFVGYHPAQLVEMARQRYTEGLELSPGTGARLPIEDEP